jgi:hypothetical protein
LKLADVAHMRDDAHFAHGNLITHGQTFGKDATLLR